jgi:aminopeptidase N
MPPPPPPAADSVERIPWKAVIAGLVVLAVLSAAASVWILRRDDNDNPAAHDTSAPASSAAEAEAGRDGEASADTAPAGADSDGAAETTPRPASEQAVTESDDKILPELGNRGYDVTNYDVALDWDGTELSGKATITLSATEKLSRISFDLVDLTVTNATVDGAAADVSATADEVMLALVSPVDKGDTATVVITYSGDPDEDDLWSGWHSGDFGVVAMGEPRNLSFWAPANDHPSDKATYDITIDAPAGMHAIFNGKPDETTKGLITAAPDNVGHRYTYHAAEPRATYLNLILIGDYRYVEEAPSPGGVPIRHVLPANGLKDYERQLAQVGSYVDALAQWFGDYPFDEYGVAVPAGFSLPGAIETQTLSLHDASTLSQDILIHELAHQWYGNSVTIEQWNDVWLNEGFATYAERLGDYNSTANDMGIDELADAPDLDVAPLSVDADDMFDAVSYFRGALTLHAVRLTIGEDDFRTLLKRWAADNQFANVTTDDFEALAEQVSGEQLDDLFDAWLREDPVPDLPEQADQAEPEEAEPGGA